jgi:hypothetical protein
MQLGQVIVNEWPYHPFLKVEGGKTNLYIYRHSFLMDGRCGGDRVIPYFEMACDITKVFDRGVNTVDGDVRGVASLRVDRMDVTSFTGALPGGNGGGSGGTGGGGGTGTGGGGGLGGTPLPPAPSSTDACFNTYRNLCDPANDLHKSLCALYPAFPFCAVH